MIVKEQGIMFRGLYEAIYSILRKIRIWDKNFIFSLVFFNVTFVSVVSQNCKMQVVPDLPLITSNSSIDAEIKAIFQNYKELKIGSDRPSSSKLLNADNDYSLLNITISNEIISGEQITSTYDKVAFLKHYAKEFVNGSLSEARIERAVRTIWLACEQICNGSVIGDSYDAPELYDFDTFSEPAIYFYNELNATQQELFAAAMERYGAFEHFWSPVYDAEYMAQNDGVDTDQMYNNSDILLAFCVLQNTADERYLWMRGYKRWLERFTTYSNTTCNGIKPDGTGFHHWAAYDNYMYAYKSCCDMIYITSGTSFQIGQDNYSRFRDAVFTQIVHANNGGLKPLSMSGRKPHERISQYSRTSLKRLAIAGGRILGLSTSDPELASQYNRLFGIDAEFNYSTIAPSSRTDGFYQYNYANMGIFRQGTWVAGMKGFTNGSWGAELYSTSNRYGRYQSYGTLEIVYDGNAQYGNGFNVNGWNWNYNPGATTRVLSWYDLNGEKARVDEHQAKSFAGALAFDNLNNVTLNRTHGVIGMFAMDFQEVENQGFSTIYHSNTHDGSFKFKKSTFVFDDFILCLGSNISSQETSPVVTTLFQRINNKESVVVNGAAAPSGTEITLLGENNNWIISNYNTGFYIPKGNNNITITNLSERTPYHNENDPNVQLSNNTVYNKWIGFLAHGSKPENIKYEYVVLPNTNVSSMVNFNQTVEEGNKPYIIHQQNESAHIVQHKASNVWGYAIFGVDVSVANPGLISNVSDSCLIMYHHQPGLVKIALSNPIFGIKRRSYEKEVAKNISFTVKGSWDIINTIDGVSIIEQTDTSTTFNIFTEYGYPYEFEIAYASQPYVPVSSISLSTDLLEIKTAQTEQLIVNVEPVDATNKQIYWSVDNTEVATVDANGLVTAINIGSTILYATCIDRGHTASCIIKVKDTNEYQAEDCTDQFGISILSDYNGYTDTGYAEYNGSGNWIEWDDVQSEGGISTLKLRYSSISDAELEIEINGTKQDVMSLANTGDWLNWRVSQVVANLQAGSNTIRIKSVSNKKILLDKINIILGSDVSINDLDDDSRIKVYPNPFSTHLQIMAAGYDHLVFYGLAGNEIIRKKIHRDNEILLKPSYSEMPPGMYFLKLMSGDGEKTFKILRK